MLTWHASRVQIDTIIMSDPNQARSPSLLSFDEKMTLEISIMQSLFASQLTALAAASRLAAIATPNPNVDPEECEEDLQLLWVSVLACLVETPDLVDVVANLIWCISKLPPPITESSQQLAANEGVERVWADTPTPG